MELGFYKLKEFMKPIYSKALFGLAMFSLGVTAVLLAQKFYLEPRNQKASTFAFDSRKLDPLFDQFYNDDFFEKSNDPFKEMRNMRERMLKQFGNSNEESGLFDSWYKKKFGGGNAGEVTKREDDKFVYYEISAKGINQDKLSVKVENGQIDISGTIENKTHDENQESHFSSSFHRSFPAPANVDSAKVQMEQEKDKLMIKFPKIDHTAAL